MKIPLPILFAIGTALCWGLYGPTIGHARNPAHSPFKPYVGIGVAYIVWAFIGGLVAMRFMGDSFSFSSEAGKTAAVWGFLAGTLGALGALSLTTAMFKGGAAMPQVVMPVVFGGAVSVTAFVSVFTSSADTKASPWLWVGIVGVGLSIILVAYNTPHAHPPKKPAGDAAQTAAPEGGAEDAAH